MAFVVTALKPFVTAAWRLVPAATKRPFVLRRAAWRLALLLWGLVAVVLGVFLVPVWEVYAALVVLLLVIVAGRFGWSRLVAPSDKPVVLVSQMAAGSTQASDHSRDHLDALVDRLASDPVLEKALEIRVLPVAVTREQARVLIEETPASVVVFGSVRVAAGTARWQAEMLLQWPGTEFTGPAAHIDIDPDPKELVVEQFGRRERAPARHEKRVDPQQPLQALTAERFDARHADLIEATLQVLAPAVGPTDGAAPTLIGTDRFEELDGYGARAHRYRTQLAHGDWPVPDLINRRP